MTNHHVHAILAVVIALTCFASIVHCGCNVIDLMCGVRRPKEIKKTALAVNLVMMALAAFMVGCILRLI